MTSAATPLAFTDPHDVRVATSAAGLLEAFNLAGVLVAADVHVARRAAALRGEGDERVLLACALAVRAPRLGSVSVDLATIRDTATVDADEPVDVGALPWPEAQAWLAAVERSPLVAEEPAPFRLDGSRLYLDRYRREERQVDEDLEGLAGDAAHDPATLGAGLARLFADDPQGRQAQAAATAVRGRFTVVAGGPGTGKTTTVARVLALLLEQADALGEPPPLVALAAPTGKAAARLQEAVHEEAERLDVSASHRERLTGLRSSTLHRLLGWRPDSGSRFRHHRRNRLPHDVVVVDETSMVSLSLMARLVEAVRPDARLLLVGDPDQLASVEAGAVLGDIVAAAQDPRHPLAGRVVTLTRVHRYGEGIAAVADAIRRGDADATIAALRAGHPDVTWIEEDAADPSHPSALAPIREQAVTASAAVADAALAGDARAALDALGAFRILCAHRRGPHGVAAWSAQVERWIAAARPDLGVGRRWYAGRPLLVTENDYELQLYNGDTGVVIRDPATGRLRAAFERRGEVVTVSPTRLGAVETLFAMTVHKAQGSQVGTAVVLLPDAESRLLTREVLYTAATRAERRLLTVGAEVVLRSAGAGAARSPRRRPYYES